MLKTQDLLVTLKILGFEEMARGMRQPKAEYLHGKAWQHHRKSLKPDPAEDKMAVSERLPDFKQLDLDLIDKFLSQDEQSTGKWTYRRLAEELFMSVGEVNQGVKRAIAAGLLMKRGRSNIRVNRPVLIEFIRYGAGIAFYTERGQIVRGIPTAYAAPVFDDIFASSSEQPPVWPCARGTVRGVAIAPLFKSVTKAVMVDPWLYQQLALVDIYRIGSAREKAEALPYLNELKGV